MWSATAPATRPVGRLCCELRQRRRWPRALAGPWVVVAAAVIAALSPTGARAAEPAWGDFGPSAGVALVSADRPAAADQPSGYTLEVTPSSAAAGSTVTFTLTFTADVGFDGGTVYLQVPPGWPPPVQDGGQGEVSCEAGCPGGDSLDGMTIVIPDLANLPAITVTYLATVPDSGSIGAFTAMAQLTDRGSILPSVSAQVSVSTSTASPSSNVTSASPSSSVTSASPSSNVTTTTPLSGPSSGLTAIGGSGPHVPVLLVPGAVVAGVALMLLGVWLVRRRPVLAAGQSVRAVPNPGRPAEFSVRVTGAEPTRTVRIEPHPGAATTSIQEVKP